MKTMASAPGEVQRRCDMSEGEMRASDAITDEEGQENTTTRIESTHELDVVSMRLAAALLGTRCVP